KRAAVEIDHRPYTLLRMIDKDTWQMEDQRSAEIVKEKTVDLLKYFSENRLIFVNDLAGNVNPKQAELLRKREDVALIMLGKDQLDHLRHKMAYVKAVEGLPVSEKLMAPVILQVWKQLGSKAVPPHWTTVARWKKRYIHHGKNAHSLRNRNFRKGNRSLKYPKEVIKIVEKAIENVYLTRERNTVADTLDSAIVHVERQNKTLPSAMQLPLPTRRLVQSLINAFDAFDRYAARYGNLAATRKFRTVLYANVTERPLECAEMDHTKLDLIAIDDDTYMPLGRPWVTICIDRDTRCVLGIYIGFEPPSYLTVARCLKHAFRPKVDLQEVYPEIVNEWISFGVMDKLVVDNGPEFHSDSLEAACLAYGINLQYTPRKTPWWKGVVERFIGTMNRGVAHGNPGTTFSGILEKDDYDALKNAVIKYSTLKKILHKWVVDVYHQKPHRSLDGMLPAIKWSSSIGLDEIRLPDNLTNLDAILGSADKRVLTHKGIEFEGLLYNSPEMGALRRRLGDKLDVDIRIDEGDLGKLFVIAPDNSEIFRVPCLDPAYANGLSSWQHKLCKRYAAEKLNLGHNSNAWRHAKEEIREIVQEELWSPRKRTRAKAKRFAGDTSATKPEQVASPGTGQITNIPSSEQAEAIGSLIKLASNNPRRKFKVVIENRKGV
ncbi:MAG: DDE-type integrase/transposase/recombinase, partial [Nitrospira sp.]|nr:DDE-type integrase/transposase/recombinase [Nitrospira sp.]